MYAYQFHIYHLLTYLWIGFAVFSIEFIIGVGRRYPINEWEGIEIRSNSSVIFYFFLWIVGCGFISSLASFSFCILLVLPFSISFLGQFYWIQYIRSTQFPLWNRITVYLGIVVIYSRSDISQINQPPVNKPSLLSSSFVEVVRPIFYIILITIDNGFYYHTSVNSPLSSLFL